MAFLSLLKLCSLATVVRCSIIITAELGPPTFKATPTWPDRNYYDEDGPPISLSCPLKTIEGVTLLWYNDGILLKNGNLITMENYNQTMTLLIPKQNQTGSYMCNASNMAGSVNHTGFIYIAGRKQETRPRITATDPEGMVKYGTLGDNITISCLFDVGGNDLALMDLTTTWLKNDSVLPDTNHSTHGINVTETKNQLFSLTITFLKISDYGEYTCFGKNKLGNDSKLITISPPKKTSDKIPWYIVVSASVGGLFLIGTIVMATMLVRRRQQWNTYKELEWQDPDMSNFQVPKHDLQYDVFISYSSNDLTWVKDVLFNTLVANGYSVCIDFKDFTPGMAISENIIDAIYKSRTTIVLLSKNFLQSMWGQFELQQAHNRAVVQRDDVLILIKYDESKVPVKLMGKTFLDWSDEKVQPHFWQRMFEALGEPADFDIITEDNINDIDKDIVNVGNEDDVHTSTDKLSNDIKVEDENENVKEFDKTKENDKEDDQDELHDSGVGEDHTDEDEQDNVGNITKERLIYRQEPRRCVFHEPEINLVNNVEECRNSFQSPIVRDIYVNDKEYEYDNVQKCAERVNTINQSDNKVVNLSGNPDTNDLIALETDQNPYIDNGFRNNDKNENNTRQTDELNGDQQNTCMNINCMVDIHQD